MQKNLIKKYEEATKLNDRGTTMRIISEEEMIAVVKAHEAKAKQDLEDGIANLHEEEALKRHKEENNAIND
jgi:hypothetical protein